MIEKIFYNVFILGTLISLFVLPILIFLAKNKYKYNFKSIYKIFIVILLLLLLPINCFNFSKIKEIFVSNNQFNTAENIKHVDNDKYLEDKYLDIQNENLIIEFDNNIDNTINVKNDMFFNIFNIASYTWISIAILLIVYNIFNYLIFLYRLKEHNVIKSNAINNAIYEISKDIKLKNKVMYRISNNITTPMTIGIFKKKIILPVQILENNEYEVILKHELFHIKNKDIEYKFLLLLLNCIYWFNPIIYNFVNQVDEIMELNCDEKVLENKEDSYRTQYAKVLLNQIEQNRNKEYSFSINFANRRKNIMNRFSSIVNKQKKKSTITLAGILTVLVALILLAVICVPNINFATIEESNIKQEENIENKVIDENNTLNEENIENKIVDENNAILEVDEKNKVETLKNETYQLVPEENISSNNEEEPVENSNRPNTLKRIDETAKLIPDDINLDLPLKDSYVVTSRFGKRSSDIHTGFDLAATTGTNIYAAEAGTVKFAGWSGGYGYMVVIEHNNSFLTCYAQCSKLCVQEGEVVEKGDVIANVGSTGNSTGPHLHFEIRDSEGNAVNPANYLTF